MRKALLWKSGLLGLVLGSCLSCSSYDGFDLQLVTTPPTDVSVSSGSVSIPRGIAVGVRLVVRGGDDPETGEVVATIRSGAPGVVGVFPTLVSNTFAITGIAEGSGVIQVLVDGQDDASVPVWVTIPMGDVVVDAAEEP